MDERLYGSFSRIRRQSCRIERDPPLFHFLARPQHATQVSENRQSLKQNNITYCLHFHMLSSMVRPPTNGLSRLPFGDPAAFRTTTSNVSEAR